MCYITRNIFTVCAHVKVGELIICEEQKARNEDQQQQNGCWTNLSLTLRSCQPGRTTRLKYWFCDDCRAHYQGHETGTRDAVLKYWAFKTARRYSFGIPPMLAPPNEVFGSAAPVAEDPKECRYELISLAKVVPRELFESAVEWLQRLETARTLTLELAEAQSRPLDSTRTRGGETASDVVRMQPRITSPMSVYPFADVGRSIAEVGEDAQELPVLREAPQVHAETLRMLCGEMAVDEPQHQDIVLRSPVLPSVQDEVNPGSSYSVFGAAGAAPPVRPLTHPRAMSKTPKQVRFQVETDNAPSKLDAEDSAAPNRNSRFSVSVLDPDEELGSPGPVSPLSDHFPVVDLETALSTGLGLPAVARPVSVPQ